MSQQLTPQRIEQLATDIFNWLVDKGLWEDVSIYFNGICWSTSNKDLTDFCYYQRRYFSYPDDPKKYFEYVRTPNILSMSFEGPLYRVLNAYTSGWEKLEAELLAIFEKYGLYFELGDAWNLTACPI